MSEPTWTDRLFGGLRKTSERLSENLAGIVTKAKLDDAQLDDIEDALILSDLGPRAAARIRERLAGERFERGVDPAGTVAAANRAAALMVAVGGGSIAGGVIDAHPRPWSPKPIRLSISRTARGSPTPLSLTKMR